MADSGIQDSFSCVMFFYSFFLETSEVGGNSVGETIPYKVSARGGMATAAAKSLIPENNNIYI